MSVVNSEHYSKSTTPKFKTEIKAFSKCRFLLFAVVNTYDYMYWKKQKEQCCELTIHKLEAASLLPTNRQALCLHIGYWMYMYMDVKRARATLINGEQSA